ncbi:MAG: hypothetical protein ABMA25_04320 [Ilumatobacteraceae bacterium]
MEIQGLPNLARPDGHWHHARPDGTEIGWRAEQVCIPDLVG